ncbi:MAG: hypothetical protein ACREDE_05275 [Thermoplasmata archaeon]
MSFVRTVDNHGHPCRQLVEAYWDRKTKTKRNRILRQLGPVQPIYRSRGSPTPETLPLEVPHFGLLATRIMTGTLTLTHIVQAVHDMGQEMPPGDLAAVGVRFDLDEKKTPRLELLLWLEPPSPRPLPAPSARPRGRSKAPANPPPSLPSKDRTR